MIVPSTIMAGSPLLFVLAPELRVGPRRLRGVERGLGVSGAAPATYAADVAPAGMNAAAISGDRMLSDLGYVVGPIALGAAADLFGADVTSGSPRGCSSLASFRAAAPASFPGARAAARQTASSRRAHTRSRM